MLGAPACLLLCLLVGERVGLGGKADKMTLSDLMGDRETSGLGSRVMLGEGEVPGVSAGPGAGRACGRPGSPAGGNTTVRAGTAVTECEPGSGLAGAAVRVCGEDGSWSGTPPLCSKCSTVANVSAVQ